MGLPLRLRGNQIYKEAQIISIAKLYHNKVYRLLPENLVQLNKENKFTQQPEITKARHESFVSFIKNKGDWYYEELHNCFIEMVESNQYELLMPSNEELHIFIR